MLGESYADIDENQQAQRCSLCSFGLCVEDINSPSWFCTAGMQALMRRLRSMRGSVARAQSASHGSLAKAAVFSLLRRVVELQPCWLATPTASASWQKLSG